MVRTDGGGLRSIPGEPLGLTSPADLRAGALGELATLMGGGARAVPLGDYLLLMRPTGDVDEGAISRYIDLLVTLTPEAQPVEHYLDLLPDSQPSAVPTDDDDLSEPEPLPRATIIRQEQEAASGDGEPLAFALVTLADAEERLTAHSPEDVARASADLRDRLETARDVRRVEPFGDLLFGVFVGRTPEGAGAWCRDLSSGEPPLFIGAVAPADGDPQAVRDAAASALRDAYDQRRSRVVEV